MARMAHGRRDGCSAIRVITCGTLGKHLLTRGRGLSLQAMAVTN